MKKNIFYFFIFLLIAEISQAQNKAIDSLKTILKTEKEDTNKVNSLNTLSEKLKSVGNYSIADSFAQKAFQLSEKINFKKGAGSSLINIGLVYYHQGNYPEALKNYFSCLEISKAIGDKKEIAHCYMDIGNVYDHQGNSSEALKNYFSALEINKAIGDKDEIGTCYSNIGNIYFSQENSSEALKNYFSALEIYKVIGDKNGIGTCYCNLGNTDFCQGNYPEALKNIFSALKILKAIGNKDGIITCYANLGFINTILKNYTTAKKYFQDGLLLSKKLGEKEITRNIYDNLTHLDSATGNWKGAYENHKLYTLFKDSLANTEVTKKTVQAQMQYDFDTKTLADSIKNTEQIKQQELKNKLQIQQQKTYTYTGIVGFLLMLLVAGFLIFAYRNKQKANVLLEEKNGIIEQQKVSVEEKNLEITSSINYALRIQKSILPSNNSVKQSLPESFIVYKPKDIVAGDFYWMENVGNKILIAACDCTGHGVPGAMVSVVCYNALNRAVREFGLTQPAAILDKTAEIVIENFAKSEEEIKDGMDISLCAIEKTANGIHLQWSGANSPLWIFKNGELLTTKADKQAIGYEINNHAFTNHIFELQKSDTLYLFSDGYADQFGGENGKKMTTKRFKDLLVSVQNLSLNEQGEALDKYIVNYRKKIEQTDDILVIGIKV